MNKLEKTLLAVVTTKYPDMSDPFGNAESTLVDECGLTLDEAKLWLTDAVAEDLVSVNEFDRYNLTRRGRHMLAKSLEHHFKLTLIGIEEINCPKGDVLEDQIQAFLKDETISIRDRMAVVMSMQMTLRKAEANLKERFKKEC